MAKLLGRFPRLQLIWAEGGYAGQLVQWVREVDNWLLEIVKRPADAREFKVPPRRWVVETSEATLDRYRRLARD